MLVIEEQLQEIALDVLPFLIEAATLAVRGRFSGDDAPLDHSPQGCSQAVVGVFDMRPFRNVAAVHGVRADFQAT